MRTQRDKIIEVTNPGNLSSLVTDMTLDTGYSLDFDVTGSLSFTAEVWAGNTNDVTKMKAVTGTAVIISAPGYFNNTSSAQYDFFIVKISAVTGVGNLTCTRVVKEF